MMPGVKMHRPLKALSMQQPWASLFLTRAKMWETRSRRIKHRGLLAIHASAGFPGKFRRLCVDEPFRGALRALAKAESDEHLPLGAIIGVVWIRGCVEAEKIVGPTAALIPRARYEDQFGDFTPGRFAWQRADCTIVLPEPIPCAGMLGLWDVPQALEMRMLEQLNLQVWPSYL